MRVLLLYLFMFAFVPCHAQTYEQYMSSRLKVRGLDSVIVYCTFFYDFRFPSPDFVIVSPKSLRQRVLLFSDVLPSALFGCKSPCSEVA